MSTQSGTVNKSKKYNTFQILFVEWFLYFVILVLLDGGKNSIEDSAGGALMLLSIIRIFLFFKKTK
jgi:hypothetical protein